MCIRIRYVNSLIKMVVDDGIMACYIVDGYDYVLEIKLIVCYKV